MKKITTLQAAKVLGCGTRFVQVAMQRGVLDIGTAIKLPGSSMYTYNISPALLAKRQGITVAELEKLLND